MMYSRKVANTSDLKLFANIEKAGSVIELFDDLIFWKNIFKDGERKEREDYDAH